MVMLVLGLLIFLGTHSIGMLAGDWRQRQINKMGKGGWKAVIAVLSLVGLVLIIYGYGQARMNPQVLWYSPVWTRHLAALLTLPAFILLVAAYIPGSRIRARVGHPMLLGVKFWAIAHLLANGNLADVVLFGSFLAWAVADFIVSRKRDRRNAVVRPVGRPMTEAQVIVLGLVAWVVFAMFLHGPLIGVRPF